MKPVKIERLQEEKKRSKFPKGAAHGPKDWRIGSRVKKEVHVTLFYTTAHEVEKHLLYGTPLKYIKLRVATMQ